MSLPELLSWSSRPRVVGACIRLRNQQLRTVAAALNAGLDEALRHQLGSLDDEGYLRIVGAPETYAQLFSHTRSTHGLVDHLRLSIALERLREDPAAEPDQRAWTATSDAYAAPGHNPWGHDEPGERGRWTLDHAYRAPRLGTSIVLDLHAPREHRMVSRRAPAHELVRHEPLQATLVQRKLLQALAVLAYWSEAAHAFVDGSLDVVTARSHASDSFVYGSHGEAIGQIRVVNAHSDRADPATLVSTLVHESIHTAVYRDELLCPTVPDASAAAGVMVTSPWTGGVLPIRTYVHACYVWYGLSCLWARARPVAGVTAVDLANHADLARRGFQRGAFAALLEHRRVVAPRVVDDLERMTAAVLDQPSGVQAAFCSAQPVMSE